MSGYGCAGLVQQCAGQQDQHLAVPGVVEHDPGALFQEVRIEAGGPEQADPMLELGLLRPELVDEAHRDADDATPEPPYPSVLAFYRTTAKEISYCQEQAALKLHAEHLFEYNHLS